MANHLQNIAASKSTATLYLNEKYADFHFLFNVNDGIQKIPVNKIILAVLSPVFDKMFFGSMKEAKEVQIVDATVGAFKEFLQFFYLDKVILSMENIETVARLADKYDIVDCVNKCAEFVEKKLTLGKMCWGYQLALFLKNDALIKFCELNIVQSSKVIFASEYFRRCDVDTLEHILRLNLTCSETDIFNACIEWAKNACKLQTILNENHMLNVRDELGDHFKLIRFGEMSIEEFIKIDTSYKGLFTPEEFKDIVLQITSAKHESNMFTENPRCYIWNNAKVWTCNRVRIDNTSRNVRCPEVVSFSSNQPVLLGEMLSCSTNSNSYAIGYEVDVSIVQLEDKTFHSNDNQKEVFNGKFKKWSNNQLLIVLPKPVLIKPQTVYEIRVVGTKTGNTYSGTWNPKANFENGLEINFHRNPSLGNDNASIGWISTLKFNKI